MLKEAILTEYGLAAGVSVFLWFLMPLVFGYVAKDADDDRHKGWEGLGWAIVCIFLYYMTVIVLSVIFLVANPIRIMIRFRQELSEIMPLAKRVGIYALVALPMPFSLLFVFRLKVEEFLYDKRYCTGKNAYVVSPYDYKSPAQFMGELEVRGLAYGEEQEALLKDLNGKFDRSLEPFRDDGAYYTPSTMMVFGETHDDYYTRSELIPPSSEKREPAYIYNGILLLDEKGRSLRYAPIGRYMMNGCGTTTNENKPFYEDYYIECKILFIDGHVYAIIGSGESRHVAQSFPKYVRPFYVLLSESGQVTTFYKEKYYPDGSIENGYAMCHHLSMWPNTRADKNNEHRPRHYPVRKVERVDRETIEAVAAELAQGVLKESILSFLRKKQGK